MKNFSQLLDKKELNVQDNGINYLPVEKLQKYIEVTKKFLSSQAMTIINYMISHNDTYIETLGGEENKNCLVTFYSRQMPSDPELAGVYRALKFLAKNDKLLEIPTLQTESQFEAIITGKESLDSIVLDLTSEKSRNELAKKWENLVHKIARQWKGKVNMTYDEIVSAAWEGFTYAMNTYGKKNSNKTDEELTNAKMCTFGQYAAYMMRFSIAGEVNNTSRLVRIPISAINKEKELTGSINKTNTISGDKKVGGDDDGNKTLFDFIGGSVADSEHSLDQQDINKLWDEVYKILDKEFDYKVIESWYSFLGLNGHEKLKNKEIADKLGCKPSLISYYCNTVNNFIKNSPIVMTKMRNIYELMREYIHDCDHDNNFIEESSIINSTKNNNMDE